MSIFRSKSRQASSVYSSTGPGGVGVDLTSRAGPQSLHSREALTTPHPSSRAGSVAASRMRNGQPTNDRRLPREAIGVNRLLDTYDEYAHLQQVVASTEAELAAEMERAEDAENQRSAIESDLKREKAAREADAKEALEVKKTEVAGKEKKVRGELEPKIKDLQERLKKTETERDGLKKEVREKTEGMDRWIGMMERLEKERQAAETRERAAAEERKKTDEKLKELNGQILKGMKDWAKAPYDVDQ